MHSIHRRLAPALAAIAVTFGVRPIAARGP
jgi:hypothetical protein